MSPRSFRFIKFGKALGEAIRVDEPARECSSVVRVAVGTKETIPNVRIWGIGTFCDTFHSSEACVVE